MKEVRFAFYLAEFQWRNLFKKDKKLHYYDDAISCWTWLFNWFTPGVSHVEPWIAGRNGNFKIFCHDIDTESSFPKFVGTCYTSTMRRAKDGTKVNGTVSRPASEVFTHPGRWLILKFEVTDESCEQAKVWADERVRKNKGYSMKDIRRFFMPLWLLKKLKWDDPEREICSEHAEGWAVRLHRQKYNQKGIPHWAIYLLMKILIRSPRRLWRDLVRRHHVPTYSMAGKMVYDEKGKRVK